MNDEQQRFVEKARASLDARSQQLSPALEGRLRAARRTALASSRAPERSWLPAMAATALVVVVAGTSWLALPQRGQVSAPAGLAVEDFDILTQDEPLTLYQDLEFYYWLDQGGEHAG